MHIHKMFKRMHKKHGGPPPPMWHHGIHGMWHHGMPKPPGMMHHGMPKPHEMWPHMEHPKMHPHMEHHRMHPHKFHKMMHKMHKKHHHKKHHGRPSSSSSSSSSSESEDESLVDGIDKVQIGDEQQGKETPGNETEHPSEGGEMCRDKFKHKRGKHFKSKEGHKDKCKCFKRMHKGAFHHPYWLQFSLMREPPCRDPKYNRGSFHLPVPESSPGTEEGRNETEQNPTPQVRFEEVTGHEKSRVAEQRSLRRGQRRGDSVDYFMQSIAEQLKKLPDAKIAEAKLKILEVVNEMQMDTAPELSIPAEDMNLENQQQQEAQPEAQSAN